VTTENHYLSLEELGWNSFFNEHFMSLKASNSIPARVVSEQRHWYQVLCQYGKLSVEISGRLRYEAWVDNQFPAVGDWVAIKRQTDESKGVIHAILPRRSKFSRKVAGARTGEQIVAANVDTVFIVSGLDGGRNLNPGRIERYLTLTWSSGAAPVIVLNKVDLCPDVDICIRDIEPIALGVPIYPVSATEKIGLDALRKYLVRGETAAFLGSSGVGKSALINALLGVERQEVGMVRRSDGKGRHTTSQRDLILLPDGGAVIDTPGMREIQIWTDEDYPQQAFVDIETLAHECYFNDCQHRTEPGCAVKAAIQRGDLDVNRFQSYRKLQRELDHLARRQNHRARLEEKARWKKISQWSKKKSQID
jgi:ribosome biogenesis GTPase